MTQDDFRKLNYLLRESELLQFGYSRATIRKFVDCAVLKKVQPQGSDCGRFQKKQLAQLLGWEDQLELADFQREPLFLRLKAMRRWTGYDTRTLMNIVRAGGLQAVQPPGSKENKFLKQEVAELIGLNI